MNQARLMLLLALASAGNATAQDAGALYKCRTPSGSWLYSDTPCERHGARQTNRPDYGPAETPIAPPSADELAARAREFASRTPAQNAAIAAASRARTEAALPKRRNLPLSPASAPATAAAPALQRDDPEGLVGQPLVTYKAPALEAITRSLDSSRERADRSTQQAIDAIRN